MLIKVWTEHIKAKWHRFHPRVYAQILSLWTEEGVSWMGAYRDGESVMVVRLSENVFHIWEGEGLERENYPLPSLFPVCRERRATDIFQAVKCLTDCVGTNEKGSEDD